MVIVFFCPQGTPPTFWWKERGTIVALCPFHFLVHKINPPPPLQGSTGRDGRRRRRRRRSAGGGIYLLAGCLVTGEALQSVSTALRCVLVNDNLANHVVKQPCPFRPGALLASLFLSPRRLLTLFFPPAPPPLPQTCCRAIDRAFFIFSILQDTHKPVFCV